ncbi:MAG: flagellar basal body-associated FliL family protein [bacterium]|nr:flagellar basal body-associated FliL family protein [bacterium]
MSEVQAGEAKSSKKTIIFLVIGMLIGAGGGIGAFIALAPQGSSTSEDAPEEEEKYVNPLGPMFTLEPLIINLGAKSSFVKIGMDFEFNVDEGKEEEEEGGEGVPPDFEKRIGQVKDICIRTISAMSAEELLTIEGKDKLRQKLPENINHAFDEEIIKAVHITSFIVQ